MLWAACDEPERPLDYDALLHHPLHCKRCAAKIKVEVVTKTPIGIELTRVQAWVDNAQSRSPVGD